MKKDKLVNDIYMLTNTDPEILDEKDAPEHLKKEITKHCKKFHEVMGEELFNRYTSDIFAKLIDQKVSLETRQEIYDAMIQGQMVGGLV